MSRYFVLCNYNYVSYSFIDSSVQFIYLCIQVKKQIWILCKREGEKRKKHGKKRE